MNQKGLIYYYSLIIFSVLSVNVFAGGKPKPVFIPMDYSTCGYHASEKVIPQVPATYSVTPAEGDSYELLQQAIDKISMMKPQKNGFRGVLLLKAGTYYIDKPLRITASGIIIKGEGRNKTTIIKRGVDRGAAVYVLGGKELGKTSDHRILISWIPDKAWIKAHKCDDFGGDLSYTGWKEGDICLTWNRTIVANEGDMLTLDAPITVNGCKNIINKNDYRIVPFNASNEISEVGIENLTLKSEVNNWNPKDEDHCWTGIYMDNVRDAWVSMVNFKHFSGSAVNLQKGCSRITVQDCIASEPTSEIGGWRRDVFITRGQQTLFQRCISREGIHDFAAGYCAAGPNAFVQCEGENSLGFSGSIGSFAPGLLFDIVNIDGNDIDIMNLEQFRTGTGWNSANTMLWQCTASNIKCYSPDSLNRNSANGCWGCLWGDAYWTESNNHVNPRSLFYDQLEKRMKAEGKEMVVDGRILPRSMEATTSPTVEQAMTWAKESLTTPRLTMEMWIDQADPFLSLPQKEETCKAYSLSLNKEKKEKEDYSNILSLGEGGGRGSYHIPWWNGRTKDSQVIATGRPAITRFVPGYEGTGWTDRIDDVVNFLSNAKFKSLNHHYGLWYDLRRIDHERIRRADGSVEAPFYEQPFARSGQGTAWDGLSKYDLTKPNKWYWERLKEFADKAAPKGIYLYHQMYFQHNILEAGAHWVDCPWRPVNNINGTTFPEPVPYAGDKRIFIAEQFYNENDTILRKFHKQYIRMCLEQLKDCPNVVHFTSAEYTGPLHFTRFWLETIAEWEAETGLHPLIALSCTKDAQDAILADPILNKVVDVIDIRYWNYNEKGLWAPEAGKNMAPRQWQRKFPVGKINREHIEKAIKEYQEKYPEKIVIYSAL